MNAVVTLDTFAYQAEIEVDFDANPAEAAELYDRHGAGYPGCAASADVTGGRVLSILWHETGNVEDKTISQKVRQVVMTQFFNRYNHDAAYTRQVERWCLEAAVEARV